MSGPVNPVFYRFFVKADAFRATGACIGCGKCVELCPLNNIHLENGKPVWGKNCTHCMACICYCPKEAIEYGKRAGESPGITLKRWKGSGTCEGERKLDEVLYLHGLGQKPDSWDRVIKETKVSDSSVCLSLAEMLEDKAATLMGNCMLHFQESVIRNIMKSSCAGFPWVLFWHLIMR